MIGYSRAFKELYGPKPIKGKSKMNERIRELAEQAKGFVDLNQHVGGEKGCMVYTYDGLEKFAELIVRECVRRIEGCSLDPTQYEFDKEFVLGYNKGVSKVASQVKLHFGVEE